MAGDITHTPPHPPLPLLSLAVRVLIPITLFNATNLVGTLSSDPCSYSGCRQRPVRCLDMARFRVRVGAGARVRVRVRDAVQARVRVRVRA